MSQHSRVEAISTGVGSASFGVIKDEEGSLETSEISNDRKSNASYTAEKPSSESVSEEQCMCLDKKTKGNAKPGIDPEEIQRLLTERETELREEFDTQMENEICSLKDKFDFILQNEQVRASYMLREAHRERQEKISALQAQLECKNFAGLIYVMCSEKRKNKLEKLRLIEDYTNYVNVLQDILTEGQNLILHLSKGYKTAARVDYEWKEKMKKVITEFQNYVYNFAGGSPESNQYFFDLPGLLQINSSTKDNPDEDPCDDPEELPDLGLEVQEEKPWHECLDGDCRPFIMYGDMADFTADQRRQTLKQVKAVKTAPRKWKEYGYRYLKEHLTYGHCPDTPYNGVDLTFNGMLLKSRCPNANTIKDEYWKHLPTRDKWECSGAGAGVQTQGQDDESNKDYTYISDVISRRATAQSFDTRGNMGSILKIITSAGVDQPATKSNLLGARDSMEIVSTTKLRERHKHSESDNSKVVIHVRNRRTSFFDDLEDFEESDEDFIKNVEPKGTQSKVDEDESMSLEHFGGHLMDSLEIIHQHVPEPDHKINYEKVCPMEKCKRLRTNSFVRSLPAYMKTNPFTHFEQNFEQYEACSPEQLEILKKRIDDKKKKERRDLDQLPEDPLAEWIPSVEGVAVQTSELSYLSLPRCTCRDPDVSPISSTGKVFRLIDLIPVKQKLDQITHDCLYDSQIEFDRFKVIGQESSSKSLADPKMEFGKARLQQIRKILKQHPSLSDLFQANVKP